MDATRLLETLCARHGLAVEDASGLLPLVQRALVSPEDVRTRLLTLIDANLAKRASGAGCATLEELERDLDDEVLRAVARTLHPWVPSARVQGLEEAEGRRAGGAPEEDSDGGSDLPPGLGI